MTSSISKSNSRWFMVCICFVVFTVAIRESAADDWPQWGGPKRDLVWRESGIVESLPSVDSATGMLPRLWTAKIGSGYAGPAVANARVYVTDRVADHNLERVLCFDANSGEQKWKHEYEAPYSISYPLGPRATPSVDGDRVYTLGAVGHLFCFDAASGKVIWQKHLPTEFGTQLPGMGNCRCAARGWRSAHRACRRQTGRARGQSRQDYGRRKVAGARR